MSAEKERAGPARAVAGEFGRFVEVVASAGGVVGVFAEVVAVSCDVVDRSGSV
ncbi:MAG: hypothetical protein V9E94_04825 [Microthrixaceae bacterium]